MARCPSCGKMASYDDSLEPEILTEEVEKDGAIYVEVRLVLASICCGEELKEASFVFEDSVDEAIVDEHTSEGHELEISCETAMTSRMSEPKVTVVTRGPNKGKTRSTPYRYLKQFYGAEVTAHITCSCGDLEYEKTFHEDTQASWMDELC